MARDEQAAHAQAQQLLGSHTVGQALRQVRMSRFRWIANELKGIV